MAIYVLDGGKFLMFFLVFDICSTKHLVHCAIKGKKNLKNAINSSISSLCI